ARRTGSRLVIAIQPPKFTNLPNIANCYLRFVIAHIADYPVNRLSDSLPVEGRCANCSPS
ncbi:MAG: hypothetical protein WBB96_18095, partial [Candidatus Dechloromonas phosphoritropha]